MRFSRSWKVILLLFFLSTIIIVSTLNTLEGYYEFYYSTKELKSNKIHKGLSYFVNNKYYKLFLTYSGLETGYGFFAPNVASEFIIDYTLFDKEGNMLRKQNSIALKNKESLLRLSASYTMFQEFTENVLKSDTLNLNSNKCKVIIKGMCYHVLEQNKNTDKVKMDLFLYNSPTIQQFAENNINPFKYILVTSRTYKKDEFQNW